MTQREFRQCWAHDPQGNRCQARGGHKGDHYLKIIWPEEQSKGMPLIQVLAEEPEPIVVTLDDTPPAACVACRHNHRSGECKCGCKEFIG